MKTSVIVITRNSAFYICDLLDSLIVQTVQPYEVIVTDAESTDETPELVKKYEKLYDFISFYSDPGSRAAGRNFGAKKATGDVVAFIDADAIANAFWIEEIQKSLRNADVVAGREVRLGFKGFGSLGRVGIIHKGVDVTYPSVNLAYKKEVFDQLEGFDPWFKEAEEVDLNFRAVDQGFRLVYNKRAIVYHRARESLMGFFKQSFWYGFGRKELTLKHGTLWSAYDPIDMVKVKRGESAWKLIRLFFASFGYFFCKLIGKKTMTKERLRKSQASER